MEKVRYMISEAAQIAGVETHVLRYWEDELGLEVPRNELGHRYYTRENIQQFQKIKELKEQGYQLKAIRSVLHGQEVELPAQPGIAIQYGPATMKQEPQKTSSADKLMDQLPAKLQNHQAVHVSAKSSLSAEERMDQFRELMSDIVGRAIAQNNEELSQNIGQEVQERVLKEMDYLMREQEEAAEERYKKLDAAIRGSIHKKKTLFAGAKKQKKKTVKLLEQTT